MLSRYLFGSEVEMLGCCYHLLVDALKGQLIPIDKGVAEKKGSTKDISCFKVYNGSVPVSPLKTGLVDEYERLLSLLSMVNPSESEKLQLLQK
ncbi:uncharacterized protein LOC113287838 isoform X5 [Papaver somniferum]|uniref:uncharacterized protein LOC113287838 isoform X5 n=1 Tax=Papaver somniferum TaxID=3469 RepID=UPI000E6FA795|nr:uncharacterized protein LOC113287838 isoform X5 [Papaver somniferum]